MGDKWEGSRHQGKQAKPLKVFLSSSRKNQASDLDLAKRSQSLNCNESGFKTSSDLGQPANYQRFACNHCHGNPH